MRKTSSTDGILTPFSEVRRTSQSHPRAPQEPQSVPRMRPGTSKDTPERPKGAPERFDSELEPILVLQMMILDVLGGHFEGFMYELSLQPALHKRHQWVLSSCYVYFRRHVVRSPFEGSSLEFSESPRLIPLPSDLSLLRSPRFPTRNDKETKSISYENDKPNDCLLRHRWHILISFAPHAPNLVYLYEYF